MTMTSGTPLLRLASYVSSDQPSSHNWPLWMFGAVAGGLTLGSIILPLVAGYIYRSFARFSVKNRKVF